MNEVLLYFALADKKALYSVRTDASLHVAEDASGIWLRGITPAQRNQLAIRTLPAQQVFWLDKDEYLFPEGSLTPTQKLDALTWWPIGTYLPVELPVAAFSGKWETPVSIRLRASSKVEKSVALLTDLVAWKAFAETASAIRLQAVHFALSEKEEVLVMGYPLPSLPGNEYWSRGSLLLPNGFDLEHPLLASALEQQWNAEKDSWLLFKEEGRFEKIPFSAFVETSRSAVRMSPKRKESHA